MDYIKNRWSTPSNGDVQANQSSQPVETPYNSVTFTNQQPTNINPIIISTQHPSAISIIHEVRNPSLKLSDLTSPTDSYHSVASNFHTEKRDGRTNMAYTGSNGDMSRHETQPQNSQNRVFHQAYWSWSWPWSSWNAREKAFLLVIVILSMCILSLTSVLSVVVQKNIQYRDMLFERLGLEV